MKSIITQKDIAHATGLDQSTVSLALSEDPRINEKTRKRVLQAARKLGYRKDPMLTALASYRDNLQQKNYHGTLAWLSDPEIHKLGNYDDSVWHYYREGAGEKASQHGYLLEDFEVNMQNKDNHRLSDILFNRGIEGVILPPLLRPGPARSLNWEHFAAVTFGWTVTNPHFHSVSPNHYHNGAEITRHFHALGYKRIASVLLMTPMENEKLQYHLWSQGIEIGVMNFGQQEPIPTLRLNSSQPDQVEVLLNWYKQYKPDAIAVMPECISFVEEALKSISVQSPDDIGIASFATPRNETYFAGIDENAVSIGQAAVDVLVGTIRRREFGTPPIRRMLQIEGTWKDGKTAMMQ